MSFAIPGLGIDMGPVEMPPQGAGQRQRAQTMSFLPDELPASLNQYNDHRRQSIAPARRPTTMSMTSDRRVRIASGQPDVLGLGDGGNSGSRSDGETFQMNRNRRLSVAVAAMSDQDWNDAGNDDIEDRQASQRRLRDETSSTAAPTNTLSGSSSLKRIQTMRRQRSQPEMTRDQMAGRPQSRVRTISTGVYDDDARQEHPRDAGRSRSAMDVHSTSMTESGSESAPTASLGRTREIPRSGSRGGLSYRDRPDGPARRHQRSATWDCRSLAAETEEKGGLVPDGFGGFVEPDRVTNIQSEPIAIKPIASATEKADAAPATQSAPAPEAESRTTTTAPLQVNKRPAASSHSSHSSVSSFSANFNPNLLRVGSFYARDGSETARLDEDGRMSRVGSSYGGSSESGHSADQSSASYPTSISSSGRSRSQSQSGPKPQFMTSPGNRSGTEDVVFTVAASQPDGTKIHKSVSMRSKRGFRGLEGAEKGEAMVSLGVGSESFSRGEAIAPDQQALVDDHKILPSRPANLTLSHQPSQIRPRRHLSAPGLGMRERAVSTGAVDVQGAGSNTSLVRQNTLLSAASNPARKVKELNHLLAPSGRKLNSSASFHAGDGGRYSTDAAGAAAPGLSRSKTLGHSAIPPAVLEQGRSGKNRVDVDLILESDLVVEGGYLRGRLEVNVHKSRDADGALMLTQPKVRVVGFEELLNDDTRHVFYHHATVIDGSPQVGSGPSQPYVLHGTPSLSPEADNRKPLACFSSQPDAEGYSVAKAGSHSIPFAMEVPVGKGAKGCYRGKNAIVRYIVIGSVKLKSANGMNRSIAHFYRHVDLFPYLNPAIVLSSSSRPMQASASKGLFLGGSGKVHLTASLHRSTWVAGQRVYVNVKIDNETNKKVKNLTLALVRTVTLFRPRPELDMRGASLESSNKDFIDPDACTTSTSRKKISEEVLEMGQKGAKGLVTARGWWTGVEGGEAVEFSHNMKLPVEALTISRGRHVEVLYSIKVSVSSSLSSDVSVELPVRIINFVSLDPPPIKSLSTKVTRNWTRENHQRNALSESESSMRGMEAIRSPHLLNTGLGLEPAYPHQSQQQSQHQHRETLPVPPRLSMQPMTESNNGNKLQVPGASNRNLQHQKSLDFINHAIRSATARKSRSNEPSPMGLGIELDEQRTPPGGYFNSGASSSSGSAVSVAPGPIHPSCAPYEHQRQVSQSSKRSGHRGQALYTHPVNLPITVDTLDDDDADSDEEEDFGVGNQTLNLNDESVAEVDFVIGSARTSGGESSPQFEQRGQLPGHLDQPYDMDDQNEEDGDLSTDTVTSQQGIYSGQQGSTYGKYHEEEPRSQRQASASFEDDRTPLAQSPSKFPGGYAARSCLPHSTSSSSMMHRTKSQQEESDDGYMTSSTSSSRRSVQTQSNQAALGRSSTIIRGPNRSRPISPSKQAPSPTKSALKLTSSMPFSSSEDESQNRVAIASRSSGAAPALNAIKTKNSVMLMNARQAPSSTKYTTSSSSASSSGNDDESSSSTSPATSASLSTPESASQKFLQDYYRDDGDEGEDNVEEAPYRSNHGGDGGLGLHIVDVTPKKSVNYEDSKPMPPLPGSLSLPSLARSSSKHNLRGATVVVPSVRDKIAMLEGRKQAMRDFTGSASPSSPADAASRLSSSNHNTPTRGPRLLRKESIISDASSPAEYLRHTPSITSFKAPLLTSLSSQSQSRGGA